MSTPLNKEFAYYLEHQDEFVRNFNGRFIVIKNNKVIGDYAEQLQAVTETKKAGHEVGTFLIQKVEPGESGYTQAFHSRVSFA